MSFKWKTWYTHGVIVLVILLAALYVVFNVDITFMGQQSGPSMISKVPTPEKIEPGLHELPQESDYKQVAESSSLVMYADASTGHFKVMDKRNGLTYHSYPNPEQWENEPQTGTWRYHLRSPLMLEYKDFEIPNTRSHLTSFLAQVGEIEGFQQIEQGFSLTFHMPSIGVSVPVRVTLQEDYIQTQIVDDGLVELAPRLIWLRLYPFFGAEHSVAGEEGYMLIPDGSGALMEFKDSQFAANQMYDRQVFGEDLAFTINTNYSNMKRVNMPVFGLKAAAKGFLAVIEDGAPHTYIKASPTGVYSQYNWITVQQNYRDTFKMIPDRNDPDEFFITYNIDNRHQGDRSVRYYLLDDGDNGYVAMAAKYRDHLMKTAGLTKVTAKKELPLHLALIGAGTKQGFITSETIKQTSTSQAMQILQRLYGLGINQMTVSYWGWQNGGYSEYGGNFPVDKWIGGNEGMKDFVRFAHSLEVPVYLNIDYSVNTTGDDGFSARTHGVRDLSGTLLKFSDYALVSSQYAMKVLKEDLREYEQLGIDGLEMQNTGTYLSSDYNTKYGGTRLETMAYQQKMFTMIKEALGDVRATGSNAYVFGQINHLSELPADFSYNIFSDRAVPFAQIALHGLISYTSNFINNHERYEEDILKDIEYGYHPSFLLTWEENKLKYSRSLSDSYSTNFSDWEEQIVKQYQRFNKALGSVQDQFIMGHTSLDEQVFQTDYENGVSVIVNYRNTPYTIGQTVVPARDFAVLKGGGQQ